MEQHARPKFILRGSLLAAVSALGMMLFGVGLLGFSYERLYAGRIMPGVVVLGVKAGGLSYSEARALVNERAVSIVEHPVQLRFSDGTAETVTPSQLGLALEPDVLVYQAYQRGRNGTLLNRWSEMFLLRVSGAAYAFTPSIDGEKLLAVLEETFQKHERPVRNANLVVADNTLKIAAEELGIQVNREQFRQQMEASFRSLALPDTVAVPTTEVAAAITKNDLEPKLAEANRLAGAPLHLTVRNATSTVGGETLLTWFALDAATPPGQLVINREAVSGHVAGLASKTNQKMIPRKVNKFSGAEIAAGRVGYELLEHDAVLAIVDVLTHRMATSVVDPVQAQTVDLPSNEIAITTTNEIPAFTPGLYSGKYIEVNLKQQRMYLFEGENNIATYVVSTGKWDMPTPQGTMYIMNHISYAYSKKYDLYMPWWMGLAPNPDGSGFDGYGIHELPEWKSGYKEGQNHLGTPVSHGCIRLGIGPAEHVYNWAPEGTPVYIHK